MTISSPYSVCVCLTEKCNANCIGCFAPHFNDTDFGLMELKEIIDILHNSGVKRVTFSGGEPTTRDDLNKIIEYAHLKGLQTALSSNGINFVRDPKILTQLNNILDELLIDYHSTSPQISQKFSPYMTQEHLNQIENLFRNILKSTSIQLKVVTVMFKDNANLPDLISTGMRLSEIGVRIWKIDQYFHVDKPQKIRDAIAIPNTKYEKLITTLKSKFSNIKIIGLGAKFKREQRNFMISPAGKAFINFKGKSTIIGDFLVEYKRLFRMYNSPLPIENYEILASKKNKKTHP